MNMCANTLYTCTVSTAFCKMVVAIVIRLKNHLWTLIPLWRAKQIPSRRCHSSYTNEKRSLQPLHKTCSCRNNSTQSSTWDLDCIEKMPLGYPCEEAAETFFVSVRTVASSRRYLLSVPKWGQGSEVSRELNDNRDNLFAKRCKHICILYIYIYN